MLKHAFVETIDYRTLIETTDRVVVVGRRGTGKSALSMRLARHWQANQNTHIRKIAPEEFQIIAIRPLARLFGERFSWIRAGMRIAWWYAFVMETVSCLSRHHRVFQNPEFQALSSRALAWKRIGDNTLQRVRQTLDQTIDTSEDPERRIGDLALRLDVNNLLNMAADACGSIPDKVVFLVDRLDEGYEPDEVGTAFVDGLIQGAIEVKTKLDSFHPTIFVRDNIFRSVQEKDHDYSRNIEGNVLRLHWDDEMLFDFATRRMKAAFNLTHEAKERIWNSCVTGDLRSRSGFRQMLRLTLYRPRDVLSLLNDSIYLARRGGSQRIAVQHIEATAKTISRNRLLDLLREYEAIVPALEGFISAFEGKSPEWTLEDVNQELDSVIAGRSQSSVVQQDLFIWESASPVIKLLFSIGFLGIKDRMSDRYVFCHDGRPLSDLSSGTSFLVHPSYWMALGCANDAMSVGDIEEIYDEYRIETSSETPRIRNGRLDELISGLDRIPLGAEGATEFEIWCFKAIRTCFAKGLHNVELRPNRNATLRRDVVGTNLEEGKAWERIYRDYGSRQVTFEVKNYERLDANDYKQASAYLGGDYGRLAFVITRDPSTELYKGRDVNWVRDMSMVHGHLIVKLTGRYFCGLLRRLKEPQKHDAVNDRLQRLLDDYTRLYLAGEGKPKGKKDRRRAQRRRRRKNRRGASG